MVHMYEEMFAREMVLAYLNARNLG